MPTTVTSRRNSKPILNAERRLDDAKPTPLRRVVQSQFVTCKAGGMLLLKLLGYIEEQRAKVLEVSDHHIVVQLGQPWHLRMWHGEERRRPVRVRLDFADPGDDLPNWQQSNARRSIVSVDIRPMSMSFRTREFHQRAHDVLRNLRLHFVAD